MTTATYSSFAQWYAQGHLAPYVRAQKSVGNIVSLIEAAQPAGDMSDPAVPDLVLYQDLTGGSRVSGDLGGGRFDVTADRCGFFLAAPNFANTVMVGNSHRLRSLSFPMAKWKAALDEAVEGEFGFDFRTLHSDTFAAPSIRSALQKLWGLCEDEGAASRLLAQAAGFEILAELCRLSGAPLAPVRGGLAPWAERRCIELLRERFAQDVSLDELAGEAGLSAFHFARMFKQSVGVPPRVYLTRLRMEKACELLATTALPVTEIALEVGYSSSQVLARVFFRHHGMTPTDYRRAVHDRAADGVIL